MQFMHSDVAKNIVANNTAESPITQVFVSITNDSLAAGSGAVSYGAGLHVVNINTTQVNSFYQTDRPAVLPSSAGYGEYENFTLQHIVNH